MVSDSGSVADGSSIRYAAGTSLVVTVVTGDQERHGNDTDDEHECGGDATRDQQSPAQPTARDTSLLLGSGEDRHQRELGSGDRMPQSQGGSLVETL